MLVGFLYDRRHTKLFSEFGGLARVMPLYAFCFCVVLLGSIGLPLTIGFVGEFLSLVGIFKISFSYALLGGLGIIMGAIYSMNLYKKTFFGALVHEENKKLSDLNRTELCSIIPICVLVVVLGVAPNLMLKSIEPSVTQSLELMFNKASQTATRAYMEKANFKVRSDAK